MTEPYKPEEVKLEDNFEYLNRNEDFKFDKLQIKSLINI